MNNIFLVGFSGTGKSEIGPIVANILSYNFIDLDTEIVKHFNKPIHKVFSEDSEEIFRKKESELLQYYGSSSNCVIATGGGVMIDDNNYASMKSKGFIVCLEAMPQTIYTRLTNEEAKDEIRPVLKGNISVDSITDIKNKRQQYYAKSDWTIHTDNLTTYQSAEEVARIYKTFDNLDKSRFLQVGIKSELAGIVTYSNGACPLYSGWGIFEDIPKIFSNLDIPGNLFLISDKNVYSLYGPEVEKHIASTGKQVTSYQIEPGEHNKTFNTISNVYRWLAESKAQRQDTVVALGGGVVGDMAGFVAATYNRGLGFIQIPTSLAAMVDASVGGKTAVDLPEGKNLVGSFYQPKVVIADVSTLRSLPYRETMEGWAEAIKHGLILDRQLFEVFENEYEQLLNLEPGLTSEVVKRSIQIKAEIVSQDEKETRGIRTLLNYGHTIGHGLETATGYHKLLHGEAVSIGMMGAAMIGNRMGITDDSILERQLAILKKFDLPVSFQDISIDSIKSAMSLDKKAVGSSINWVLLPDIGHAVVNSSVDNTVVDEVLEELSS
jgi:3-dehydroquinate synthase